MIGTEITEDTQLVAVFSSNLSAAPAEWIWTVRVIYTHIRFPLLQRVCSELTTETKLSKNEKWNWNLCWRTVDSQNACLFSCIWLEELKEWKQIIAHHDGIYASGFFKVSWALLTKIRKLFLIIHLLGVFFLCY